MRMKLILKGEMYITWVVLWSNIMTRHNQEKQLKETKKEEMVQNNQNHNIIFKESLQDHNIGLILILTGLKTILLQGSLIFQNTIL